MFTAVQGLTRLGLYSRSGDNLLRIRVRALFLCSAVFQEVRWHLLKRRKTKLTRVMLHSVRRNMLTCFRLLKGAGLVFPWLSRARYFAQVRPGLSVSARPALRAGRKTKVDATSLIRCPMPLGARVSFSAAGACLQVLLALGSSLRVAVSSVSCAFFMRASHSSSFLVDT